MKLLHKSILSLSALLLAGSGVQAANYAWPERFEGVMLQGFYWDSYKGADNTKWSTLTQKADELSKYFKVIWVPNSAKPASSPSNGYDPVYWFTNHNSSFGSESQIREMIKTYRAKNVDIIEDVVINHRSGVSNWTNFPSETWNGKTYKLGPEHICNNDEVAWASGQAKPTGAADTGENFDGSRDLDHTNRTVQEHCKAYCTFLLQDMGYAGFRYDMVKGYSGQYTKIYNEASKPKYSVGEYWDGSYDAVKMWIESTGRQSAAFDFPCKYAINEAFHNNDMTKLVWKANGTTNQPAGIIHFGYAQYAVTFIDNHDTYRDGSKFNGNVLAANAFILCSPGTPCVFWPHYSQNKEAIQALINVRNAVGVHNQSAVTVLKSTRDCYMAEVTGSKGKLVVKIGPSMDSPNGYSNSDIKASGNDYCVWSKVGGVENPTPIEPVDPGASYNIYWDNSTAKWATPHIHYWGATEPAWPGVAMTKLKDNVWVYTVPAGTTGVLFNAGDGDASKTGDFTAVVDHIYNQSGDQGKYSSTTPVNPPVVNPGNYPAKMLLIGDATGWLDGKEATMTTVSSGVYTYTLDLAKDANFRFMSAEGASWDSTDQWGGSEADYSFAETKIGSNTLVKGKGNFRASEAGTFTVKCDLTNMTMTLTKGGGNDDPIVGPGNDLPAKLYLVGAYCDWTFENAKPFTKNGNVYTLETTIPEGEWKIDDGTWEWGFGNTITVNASTPVDAWFNAPEANFTSGSDIAGKTGLITLKVVDGSAVEGSSTPAVLTVTTGTSSSADFVLADDSEAIYFNLQGQKVANPANGIYVKVVNGKASKVYVK